MIFQKPTLLILRLTISFASMLSYLLLNETFPIANTPKQLDYLLDYILC